MAIIMDGRPVAAAVRTQVAEDAQGLRSRHGRPPRLDVVLVGDDQASRVYVNNKFKACAAAGLASTLWQPSPADLLATLADIQRDPGCDGLLVQLPLPDGAPPLSAVYDALDPDRDVDVFHPANVGRLLQGRSHLKPCTPQAVQRILRHYGVPIAGQHVVILNRSAVVGQPLSGMLIQDCDSFGNATVTVCHNRTGSALRRELTAAADIVVVAVGIPNFLTAKDISPGCVVVDVGINRLGDRVVGDCDPSVAAVARAYTPVPGGVGPVTVAMLLANTVNAMRHRYGEPPSQFRASDKL